jgi:hypothetical protein
MKQNLFPIVLLLLLLLILNGCGKFEPELKGWKAYTLPGKPLVHLEIDGRETTVGIEGNQRITYRYPQWTKFEDHILLAQVIKTERCYDFQIITIDTTGAIIDTVYTAPSNTPINFKLAPNDSLLVLKTYNDDCEEDSENFKYTFYNRFTKQKLSDTISVGNARGIPLLETVWSPDSKKVIISQWSGGVTKTFTYNLITKDTAYIDKGSNFIWSPTDNNLVAYIKDYSILTRNMETGEREVVYKGKKKKSATDFRWDPTGEYLMIQTAGYLLNVEAPPLQTHNTIYLSMKEKTLSKIFFGDQKIHTWKEGAAASMATSRER